MISYGALDRTLPFETRTLVMESAKNPAMPGSAQSLAGLFKSPEFKKQLASHLSAKYATTVSEICNLDENVFRIDRSGDVSWVARLLSPSLQISVILEDAEILRILEQQDFPAERLAHPEPVSTTPAGYHVLITTFIDGRRPRKGEQIFPKLGDLLGRLHTLSLPEVRSVTRRGGAWHHICHSGGIREELDAALSLLEDAKLCVPKSELHLYEELRNKLNEADDFSGLPQCFIHPDFVTSNSIISAVDNSIQIVDWSGAGTGPRVVSLGYLLWTAGQKSSTQMRAVAAAYATRVSLEEGEIMRLKSAMISKPLILRSWEFSTARVSLEDSVQAIRNMEELVDTFSVIAKEALKS